MIAQLPHNLDAEQALIGALLTNRDAIIAVADSLKAGAFYSAANQQVYTAILTCYQRGTPPDFTTVSEELRRKGQLEQIGGITALIEYTDAVNHGYHVSYYADILRPLASRRNAINASGKIAQLAYDESTDLEEQIPAMYAALNAATQDATPQSMVKLDGVLDDWFHSVTETGQPKFGIQTGYRDLDQITGGLQRTDLIILAARPGVGKTSLMMGIVDGVCANDELAAVFSLEMGRDQLVNRLVSMHTGIDSQRLRRGIIGTNELPRVADAMNRLKDYPLWIDDTAARTVYEIRTQAQRCIAQNGPLGLITVDYLGLMKASDRYAGQKVNEVSELSAGLKAIAKELDCPVLALHQLSRAVEGRPSHVPMLSDLRDSGSVEQDADIVMFIYREEMYERETDKKGIAEIHFAKHRNGPVGVVPMRFDASTTKFSDLAPAFRTPEGY